MTFSGLTQYNRTPVPVRELWQNWESGRDLNLPWFFETLEGFEDIRPIVPFTDFESDFFKALKLEFQKRKIKAEYLITADDFFKLDSVPGLLAEELCLSIVIFKPLGLEVVQKIKSMEKFMDQLKFILLVRRDWKYENTYRSLPYFIRPELFVDFPLSLASKMGFSKLFGPGFLLKFYGRMAGDRFPFFSIDECWDIIQSFKQLFPDNHLSSYCPNLLFYDEFLDYNISHMELESSSHESSKPGENCKLSIIVEDQNLFKDIVESLDSRFSQNPVQIEILTWGFQPQADIFQKISVRPCQVVVKDSRKVLSKAVVNNFLATKAVGEFLFFADRESFESFGSLLNFLFESSLPTSSGISKTALTEENKKPGNNQWDKSFDEFDFLFHKKTMIFEKKKFLKTGGFDPLFSVPFLVWFDILFRYSSGGKKAYLKDSFSSKYFLPKNHYEKKGGRLEKSFLFHKYLCEESFISSFGKSERKSPSFLKKAKRHGFQKKILGFFFLPLYSRILCAIHYFFTVGLFYNPRYGKKYFLKQLFLKFKKNRK